MTDPATAPLRFARAFAPRAAALPLAPALALALALGGCLDSAKGDDSADSGELGDTGGDTGGGPAGIDPLLNECEAIPAESLTGPISFTCDHAGELLTPFEAPIDRRSGLLTFSLVSPRSDDDLVTMGLTLSHPQRSTFQVEIDVAEGEGVALAGVPAPGETVVMGLAEWGRGSDAPESYIAEAAWTWTEYDDCFEPNDVVAQAKHVPTGVEHTAWMVSTLGESTEPTDWYRFTIVEDSVVQLSLRFPESIPMWVELFAGDRSEADRLLTVSFNEVPGEFDWSSEEPLPAGTYSLRLAPFVSLNTYDTPLRPYAPHLYNPYTFRVDATPAR